MLSFGKIKSCLAAGLAISLLSACATKDGINSETDLSTASVPVAGEVAGAAGDVAQSVGDSAVDVATGIVVAPFEVAESLLGLDQNGQATLNTDTRARTYDERLSLRRSQRGLPKPADVRVKERQAAMRTQYRRPAGF